MESTLEFKKTMPTVQSQIASTIKMENRAYAVLQWKLPARATRWWECQLQPRQARLLWSQRAWSSARKKLWLRPPESREKSAEDAW